MAIDTAGNKGYTGGTYTISNDPPAAPTGLEVYAGEWKLTVTFKAVGGSDFNHYNIYRKSGAENVWTLIAETTSNVYVDRRLDPADYYDYKVTVVNDLMRESGSVETTGITNEKVAHQSNHQTTKPIIRKITPASLYFKDTLSLKALVEDDIGVSKVVFEYKKAGESTTQLIAEVPQASIVEDYVNLTPDYEGFEEKLWSAACDWDASQLSPGEYEVIITAYNMGGAESCSKQLNKYNLVKSNNRVPAITSVINPKTGGSLTLSLTLPAATEAEPTPMDYFTIYRSEQSCSGYVQIADKVRGNYTDTNLTNGTVYYYIVTVTDLAGNLSGNSAEAAGMPTAESGLTIRSAADILVSPEYPVAGRSNTVTAKVFNAGYATAGGAVLFSVSADEGASWTELGSASFSSLAGNTGTDVQVIWNPDSTTAAGTNGPI